MTKTRFLTALMTKLVGVRIFVKNEVKDTNKHPAMVHRAALDGFLRITQTEILEALGVSSPKKLTKTLRGAIRIVARIHKGCDSYKTIADKAEIVIKTLHPLHTAELERVKLEASKRAVRETLETRFSALTRGKALPVGIETPQLSDMVGDMRDELEATTQRLMDEVNELALRHPDVGRINDKNLLDFASRLESRRAVLKPVRTSLGSKLRELIAT